MDGGGGILDADDIAFLESGAPSPAQSDISHGSGKNDPNDESSNEALVVDCDSPGTGTNTPGESFFSICCWFFF